MKDDKQLKLDKATMCIGITLMSLLVIALTVAMCRLCKHARFKFLFMLIVLLVISDCAFALLSVCFYFEQTEFHEEHT